VISSGMVEAHHENELCEMKSKLSKSVTLIKERTLRQQGEWHPADTDPRKKYNYETKIFIYSTGHTQHEWDLDVYSSYGGRSQGINIS
jgi:hypothetical protein